MPAVVVERLRKGRAYGPTPHSMTVMERRKISEAFGMLPRFELLALTAHLHSISLVDRLGGNAMTFAEDPTSNEIFDIVIDSRVLTETVSGLLTRKERSCYAPSTATTLAVEAGSLDAVVYVLLHEAMHVVDMSNMPATAAPQVVPPRLAANIWADMSTIRPPHQSSLLGGACFHGLPHPEIDTAEKTYAALEISPFVSLYGTGNWLDDSAELLAMYHLTRKLGQPYRIVVRRENGKAVTFTPMDSPRVTARLLAVHGLYQQR